MQLQTTPNRTTNKPGFSIGVTCPGCGGKLQLDEDFFVLPCTHCGSILKVNMPDIPPAFLVRSKNSRREARFAADRALKKRGQPLTESGVSIKGIYYPYWKADGVLLRVRNQVIERCIHIDQEAENEIKYEQQIKDIRLSPHSITILACPENELVPNGLGMRSEYIRLMPYSDENIEDEFVSRPVLRNCEDILNDIKRGIDGMGAINPAAFGKNRTKLFHPVFSLLYFPYYIVESIAGDRTRIIIVDGVTNRVAAYDDTGDSESFHEKGSIHPVDFGELTVDFHRCRNCGMDLPPKQSFVYICANCNVVNTLANNNLLADEILATENFEQSRGKMIPFWSFKIPMDEARALRGMFGGIYNSDRLFIPAVKVRNFEAVFKLAKRMSAASARLDFAPVDQFNPGFEPVSMSMDEALTMAEIIIYRALIGRNDEIDPGEIEFNPLDVSLNYVPFELQSYYYVDSVMNAITFEKALLD